MPWVQLGKYVCLFLSVNGPNPEGDALFPSFSSFFDVHAFLVNRRKAQLRCATMRQLTNAARSFEDDAATSVVVLTGGAKSFTAGFDLKDPEGRSRPSCASG